MERLRAIGVRQLGSDAGQAYRRVLVASIAHIGKHDVIQHAAGAVAVQRTELEPVGAIREDRQIVVVGGKTHGSRNEGTDRVSIPENLDSRVEQGTTTRRIIEVQGVG
ncbi:hypothetical protein D3C71_1752560 [compost metagenome]